jgi:hypothetical protein
LTTLSVLDLAGNSIANLAGVTTLAGIKSLDLTDNPFTDITPLANNPGFGPNDLLYLSDKTYCNDATINALKGKGVSISYQDNC